MDWSIHPPVSSILACKSQLNVFIMMQKSIHFFHSIHLLNLYCCVPITAPVDFLMPTRSVLNALTRHHALIHWPGRSLSKFTRDKKLSADDHRQGDAQIQKLLKMYQETKQEVVDRSPDEVKAGMVRAKEYNKQKMQQHRDIQADMSQKRRLLKAALRALPEHLRSPAEEIDDTPPPTNMPFPTDTPPTSWR